MNEITEENLIISIREKFSKFQPYWQSYANERDLSAGLGDDMKPFIDYVVNVIKSGNYREVEDVFNYIEFLVCSGDALVQMVVENCILVPLIYKNNLEIQFINFSKYLGKETLNFLKTWLKYDGTCVEGL
jgi:hypothetical protein